MSHTKNARSAKIFILGLSCLLAALALTAQAVAWVVANRRTDAQQMAVYLDMPRGVFATSTPAPLLLSSADMSEYDFQAAVGLDSDRILNPVSTLDTDDWYIPNDVLSDGTANEDLEGDVFYLLDDDRVDEYIINQTFYMVNTYTEDVTLYLKNVNITRGTGVSTASNLYHAVRVAVTYNGNTTIYRFAEGANNYGAARPVNGLNSTSSVDNSLPSGLQVPAAIQVALPAAVPAVEGSTQNMTLTTANVNIKIWIEGQNVDAVSAYAGTSFRVSLTFSDTP